MGDIRADDDSRENVRWLTYEQAGRVLGIDAGSVSRRARRLRWRRQPGNDGRTRVAVPLDVIPDSPPDAGAIEAADIRRDDQANIEQVVPPDTGRVFKALAGEIAALREALDRERERVVQAEFEAREARRAEAEARERAARAEAERDALRENLDAAGASGAELDRRALAAERRAGEAVAVLGRISETMQRIQQERVGEGEAAARTAEDARAALARADEAERRARDAEARSEDLRRELAAAPAVDPAEVEAARARAAEEAERAAGLERELEEARRRAAEAERVAAAATARLDGVQRDRLEQAQAAAEAARPAGEVRRPPLWHRVFRRRS